MHAMTEVPATNGWSVRYAFALGCAYLGFTILLRAVVGFATGLRDPWREVSELPPYEYWVNVATLTAPITFPIIALVWNWFVRAFRWLAGPSIDPRRSPPSVIPAAEAAERKAQDATAARQGDARGR
jgi:hypothetical protein